MFSFNCKGRLITTHKPVVMGIINATPDSFYSGSRKTHLDEVVKQAGEMLRYGAFIIDVGGQSTRPGSKKILADEELERVIPVIETIKKSFPEALLSVDTYYSKVAEQAVQAGADMVNDISAGQLDADMLHTVAMLRVPYICMHMKGDPQTMHLHTDYNDLFREVLDFFIYKLDECKKAGINDVIIDPGFGFSKTIPQNFELLRKLNLLKILNTPILAGLSRKGTIYKTLGISAEEALNGTTVLNTIALLNGAQLLRVHDVKEACETIELFMNYSSTAVSS